jgi:hypothetical protein
MRRPPDTRNLPVGRHRQICKRDRLAGAIEREDKGSLHALQGRRLAARFRLSIPTARAIAALAYHVEATR